MRRNKKNTENKKKRVKGAKMQIIGRILAAVLALAMMVAACSTVIFYIAG